jgi:hypothetical protein
MVVTIACFVGMGYRSVNGDWNFRENGKQATVVFESSRDELFFQAYQPETGCISVRTEILVWALYSTSTLG